MVFMKISFLKKISAEQFFMLSMVFVNGGNYVYNLLLGRVLGPALYADAAILVTFLLVLSFVGMAFQVVTTKFIVGYTGFAADVFERLMYRVALLFGIIIGFLIVLFSDYLSVVFNTISGMMFVVFGVAIPLYFLMSVKRGVYQGNAGMVDLSKTYIFEMLSRLLLTFTMILLLPDFSVSVLVAMGIGFSFVFGLLPFGVKKFFAGIGNYKELVDTAVIWRFFGLTAFYEMTQIIINNSDVMLVKHYFGSADAGLYASLALIGRVVYFVAWMFVMLLLPKVLQLQKEGKPTKPILIKYVFYIVGLSISIIFATTVFPETVVYLMFGKAYLPIAFLLWKYALATSIFAVANIFAYYFLSISKYLPVVISGVLGLLQIVLIVLYHNTLEQVVDMQIVSMGILLGCQLVFFAVEGS
jgi:O-antigen/teichoic acid export membrane protein